VFDTVIRF